MNGKLISTLAVSMAALWTGPTMADRTPWTHLNYQDAPGDFRFAIVPDRTGGDYRGAFTNALAKVNLMHPEFTITVGDLIQGAKTEKELAWKSKALAVPSVPETAGFSTSVSAPKCTT